MGGGVGARPHRPFPEVPASAALAGRSGLPPGGPGPVSATEERQLLSRREQAGGLAGACSPPGARAGHPPRSFRAGARLPPRRDARVHPRLESRDHQLPPEGGAGPRAFGARQQRADPRRCRGLWRVARLHPRAARPSRHPPHPARQLQAACALPSARGSGVTKTVLVLRFSAVGDVVLTAPAIAALREAWPDARIVYAIKERLAHLVEHNPNIDEVIALRDGEGPFSYASRLRAARPGVVLDLHGKIRSRILRALLPGVPKVVWHKRDFRDTLPVKLALRPYRASMLFADRYHAAVEEVVGRALPKGKLQYFLGPEDLAVADGVLRKSGLDPERPLLGISPGANWATKRWPAERFAGLARRALERGFQVAAQGSAREADLARTGAQHAPGARSSRCSPSGRGPCCQRELAAGAAAHGVQLLAHGAGGRPDLARARAPRAGARRSLRGRYRASRREPGRAPCPRRGALGDGAAALAQGAPGRRPARCEAAGRVRADGPLRPAARGVRARPDAA